MSASPCFADPGVAYLSIRHSPLHVARDDGSYIEPANDKRVSEFEQARAKRGHSTRTYQHRLAAGIAYQHAMKDQRADRRAAVLDCLRACIEDFLPPLDEECAS